jgi:hypothetical protein
MKFVMTLSLLLFLTGSSFTASAQMYEKPIVAAVESSQLKLLGKGIRDRKTNASLTLICVGTPVQGLEPECNQLRWVLSNGAGQNFYVGEPLNLRAATPEDLEGLKVYLKKISKNAKSMAKNPWVALGSGGATAGGMTLVAASGALTGGLTVALVGGWFLLVPNLGNLSSGTQFISGHATLQTENTEGWNWSSHAKGVGHTYFKAVFWQAALYGANVDWSGRWTDFSSSARNVAPEKYRSDFGKNIYDMRGVVQADPFSKDLVHQLSLD